MAGIFAFTEGPESWRALLADPERHWRTGFSARTLAHCWEAAPGFPPEVARAMATPVEPLLAGLTPVLGIPEFTVPLPGGARPSQNDLFVLCRSNAGPVSMMVEGKVEEPFGPTLDEWRREASPGKQERLAFLLETLGLPPDLPGGLRYQLLHRAASALLVAESFRAVAAVLLIHSFSPVRTGIADYQAFAQCFRASAAPGSVHRLNGTPRRPLYGVWVEGDPAFLER